MHDHEVVVDNLLAFTIGIIVDFDVALEHAVVPVASLVGLLLILLLVQAIVAKVFEIEIRIQVR